MPLSIWRPITYRVFPYHTTLRNGSSAQWYLSDSNSTRRLFSLLDLYGKSLRLRSHRDITYDVDIRTPQPRLFHSTQLQHRSIHGPGHYRYILICNWLGPQLPMDSVLEKLWKKRRNRLQIQCLFGSDKWEKLSLWWRESAFDVHTKYLATLFLRKIRRINGIYRTFRFLDITWKLKIEKAHNISCTYD